VLQSPRTPSHPWGWEPQRLAKGHQAAGDPMGTPGASPVPSNLMPLQSTGGPSRAEPGCKPAILRSGAGAMPQAPHRSQWLYSKSLHRMSLNIHRH